MYSFGSQGATPHAPEGSTPIPSGSTPQSNALNMAQGVRPAPMQVPLMPPTNQQVKSHTITHPDGTSIVQTYHPPMQQTPGMLGKESTQKAKIEHPVKLPDGRTVHIDSQGNLRHE